MLLSDKLVVIAGGSQGLGRAIALRLASEGAFVWVFSRNETNLKSVVNEIKSRGGKANFAAVDVSSKPGVESCVRRVLREHPRIDILVNCAGIWLEGPTENSSPEKVCDVFRVNTIGTIYTTQAVLPFMRQNHAGHIINVISTAGVEPSPRWSIYAASKYGVHGFTESLKLELEGSGVKVTGFYPGGMNTGFYSKAGLSYSSDEPWMMAVEDVAEIVCYILTRPDDIVIDHLEVRKVNK
jgi:short-subunit dehydrogenase